MARKLKTYTVKVDQEQSTAWERTAKHTGFDSVGDWLSVVGDREVERLADIADEAYLRQAQKHVILGVKVRRVEPADLGWVYRLALRIPELQASSLSGFMGEMEFGRRLFAPNAISLLAENARRLWGFVHATVEGPTVYVWHLGVIGEYRGAGVATQLLATLFRQIPPGTLSVGGFAYADGEVTRCSVVRFLERHGFTFGKRYLWADKVL
jgi:ribosomal protein S18 acetylase RimI-like enzyme